MSYLSDIEIAQAHTMRPITDIAAQCGIDQSYLELYGRYKAKIDLSLLQNTHRKGKLILVTAMTPTPAGEGKTTTTVGLADGLRKIGKNAVSMFHARIIGKRRLNINTIRPFYTRFVALLIFIPHSPFGAPDTTLSFQKIFSENFSLRIKLLSEIFF